MNSAAPPARLPRVVRRLGAVSFLNDLASEMVYPLLPALITLRLGGGAITLGALDGLSDGASAAAKLAAGWLSDRPRWRRPLVVGGYALAAIVRPLMALVGAAWQVVGLRFADRLGKGVRNPPRDAIIADAAPEEMRGRAFGFHRGMDHAGAVVGPLVAWLMLSRFSATPEQVIVWSLLPGALAVTIVFWALRTVGERAPPARPTPSPESPRVNPVPGGRGGQVLFALIVAFAFARFPEALLLLRLQETGVAIAAIPVLWAAMHVVRSLGSYPGGWLSDVLGPRRTMVGGWLVYAVVCLGLATAPSPLAAAAWFLVFGFVAAATESPERALVAAAATAARRGRGYGLYHACVGLAALPGSLLLGVLYARLGAPVALLASAGVVLVLAALGVVRGKGGRDRRDGNPR